MATTFPVLYLVLLLGLLSLAGWAVFRQVLKTRRVETTLNRLQNKLSKEKGTAQEYYELGSIYLDKKIFSQAVNLFQKALKADDFAEATGAEQALVYNALGFAYFAQEQYDLAIRHYKEATKSDPQYVTALNNLGHAYERKQLTAQAVEIYDQALAVDPNNTTAKRRSETLRKRMVPSA